MTHRTRQALAGITLAALIGLPAGLLFGRSTTAGANAPTNSVPDAGAGAASTTLNSASSVAATSSSAPTRAPTHSAAAVAPAVPTAATATTAATAATAPSSTIGPATSTSVSPSTIAPPTSTVPVGPAATPAAVVPVAPDASPPVEPTTSAPEIELTDPDMLGREISTEPSMLGPGQIDRISWIATPSVRRALVTVTVRFVGAGTVLAEYSTDLRFVGRVDRAGSVRATVPDGATAIEIEWLSVGGPVDVHDIDINVVETAPPAPYDQP